MDGPPRICVVIPVFNHGLTVGRVARGAKAHCPVLVVNDGSTDDTPTVLSAETGITVVTLPNNQGKAAALRAGFVRAEELGFTHAITIDADGQHSTDAVPEFIAACRRQPEAFLIGVRDFKAAGAPFARRATNALSNFWFRFETGTPLGDTQCGYRCYPLAAIRPLRVSARRYAYELEIMVKAAWAGVPLVPVPVAADYAAPTSRMSHFHPVRDMVSMSRLHGRLSMTTFCVPLPLRRLSAQGVLHSLPRRHRVRTVLRHLFAENIETPGRVAAAVCVGLFCGIAPIWGFQMFAAALVAHRFGLNKAIALTASNISFPLAAPFILAAGLALGHFLWTGGWVALDPETAGRQIPLYFWEWFFGSFVLAFVVSVIGGLAALGVAQSFAGRKEGAHD